MIVLVIADLHIGSTLGIWPPGMTNEDGAELPQNKFQAWLWERWQEMRSEVRHWQEVYPGEEIVIVVAGDIIQGSHAKDGQLTTARADIQAMAALDILKPLRDLCDRMYLLHGTGWHGGPASSHLGPVGKALDAVQQPDTKSWIWWELYLDMDGHLVHFTHHVAATSLPFYEATAPLRDLYVLGAELARVYGAHAPKVDLDVRAHRHRCIHIHKPPHIHVLTLPAWQLRGEFAFKVAASSLPDIGYAMLRSSGAGLEVKPVVFELPALHIERARA